MGELFRRYGYGLSIAMVLLTAFWLLALVIIPNLVLFEFSFKPYLPVTEIGGPKDFYSFNNYLTFLNSPIHITIFWKTVLYSSIVTFICLAMSYPLAYFLSKIIKPANAPTIFLLLLIPLWVSEILRSFAWFIILAFQGPLNALLQGLPIYNAISSLDTNQIEAAQDLGSSMWRTHWRVVIPHSKPGIASGCVMVFMLCAGSVIVPSTLASTNSRWFTEIIQQWMFEGLDWNTGAAYAFLLLLLCILFVSLVMRLLNVRLVDIAK
jgi:spermidine/putrescine transport system permease protein